MKKLLIALSVVSASLAILAVEPAAHADEVKVFVQLVSYTPNSGTADGCRVDPLVGFCENVHVTADPTIRAAFDAAMPGLVGRNTILKGSWTDQAAGNFTVIRVPVPQPR